MIVLTGATGFVGSRLVPRMDGAGDVLLVSRDPAAARSRFPGIRVCGYDELPSEDLGGAVFIHLAARNNDRPGTPEEFRAANVDNLLAVAAAARRGGAARFVNICSTHALDPAPGDGYGSSKREGARQLAAWWPEGAVNLYLPAVYDGEGDGFRGRLGALNRLPAATRPIALSLLRHLKPAISIGDLSAALRELASEPAAPADAWRTERYVADPVPDAGAYAAVKRLVDLSAALGVLVLGGWAMALIALWVRLDSPGPAVFAQRRVGRHGREFTCYKFRTMAVGTASAATHDVPAAAVTRAGRILPRTKLDEVPQMLNVLLNDMSLVGPRPCLPSQTELIARRRERGVLRLKPGITGLAQIGDVDMSDPARLAAWDDRYRAFRTSLADFSILLRTVLGRGSGDRVAAAPA